MQLVHISLEVASFFNFVLTQEMDSYVLLKAKAMLKWFHHCKISNIKLTRNTCMYLMIKECSRLLVCYVTITLVIVLDVCFCP